jgi:hypothetical protein
LISFLKFQVKLLLFRITDLGVDQGFECLTRALQKTEHIFDVSVVDIEFANKFFSDSTHVCDPHEVIEEVVEDTTEFCKF